MSKIGDCPELPELPVTFATGGTPNTVEYLLVAMGACCLNDGTCRVTHAADCTKQGGTFAQGTECSSVKDCCVGGSCRTVDSVCCTLEGGTPAPPGVLCEGDADGDGVDATCGDACPDDPEKTAPGLCGCGIPDLDSDGDTVPDCRDLCPNVDDRVDKDGDGYPDCALGLARIPTVSLWGVCILTLLLLIAGKISFQRPGSRPGTLT